MSRWRKTHGKSPWEEKTPYRKCPNCGKHKYRTLRAKKGYGIIAFFFNEKKEFVKYKSCDNCKKKSERWTEDIE